MQQLVTDLAKQINGEVLADEETLEHYSRDASLFQIKPKVVTFPKDTEDIQSLVRYVAKHRKSGLSLTPRSAGTDMTGGPLTESIVVDMNRHFNHILHVGGGGATTEPGVFYRDFEKATLEHNLLLPCYTASRELNTVGGMAANNSGGEKTLTYGKTEDYVTELEVVLRDGNVYTLKPLNRRQLDDKMKLAGLEGELYRKTFALLENNYDKIKAAKPNVSKNSAGYLLWNVWDRKTFDLTKLFVGSQGTLGIITKIKLRLVKPKKRSRMLVVFLTDLAPLGDIVNTVLQYKPESFESYDDHTLGLAIRFFPEILKAIKAKNAFKLGLQFIPEMLTVLTSGVPKLILMAEFAGDSDSEVQKRALAAQTALAPLKIRTLVTKNKSEGKKYWIVRRESFNLLRHHIKGKHTAPFIDDIVVTPAQLPEFLPELNAVMKQYNLIYTIAGHVGDANFHIIPLMDLADPESHRIIPELSRKVYDLVLKYHGSISGEHNDGLIRTPFLRQMYGDHIYKLFGEVKDIFDPENIFNPGKKVDAKMSYAMNHLVHK
jgi:FAD/FMN-containing dehydrogenase